MRRNDHQGENRAKCSHGQRPNKESTHYDDERQTDTYWKQCIFSLIADNSAQWTLSQGSPDDNDDWQNKRNWMSRNFLRRFFIQFPLLHFRLFLSTWFVTSSLLSPYTDHRLGGCPLTLSISGENHALLSRYQRKVWEKAHSSSHQCPQVQYIMKEASAVWWKRDFFLATHFLLNGISLLLKSLLQLFTSSSWRAHKQGGKERGALRKNTIT